MLRLLFQANRSSNHTTQKMNTMSTTSSAFQNSTKCMSKSTTKCKEKGGAKSTFGINRNGKRFILWCGLCAKKEYAERALLPEQQASKRKLCIVCNDSRPSFGLPGSTSKTQTHCKPCLAAHCAATGVNLDICVDFHEKCTHVGCTRRATQGMTWDPRLYCASHARDAWVCGNVPFPNRVNSSGKMPTASKSYSRVSIEFLDWLSLQLGIHIQHAESKDDDGDEEGEHKLVVAGRKFKADGFCDVNGLRVCIEFQGCVWHGCTECFADRDTAIKGKTRDERLHETLIRAEAVRATGYDLIEIWEHEWDEMENNEALKAAFVNQVRKQLQLDSAVRSAPSSAPIQIQKTLFDVGFRAGQKRTRE